jgi:hypothetical protein
MENSTSIANLETERPRWIKYLLPVTLLLVLLIAFFAYQAHLTNNTLSGGQLLSQAAFEEQYGLQVRLIGVTGGGGLVDFRLKMINAEKARLFLQDPDNLPILLVTADGTQILAADSMDDDIQWEDGGILFMLLPNSEGLIQPESPVTVKFGDIQLEPIPAQ